MHICTIQIEEYRVTFESSRNIAPLLLEFAKTPAFLGLRVFSNVSAEPYYIRYQEQDELVIQYSLPRTAFIGAPWNEMCGGETLLYAAIPFLEAQRQQNGFVTAHAAAVAFPKGGILILGKEGSGKTTTALRLCQLHQARLIGNDLVVVGSIEENGEVVIPDGTKFLSLRYESIRRNLPDLLYLFPTMGEDPWLQKVLRQPAEAGISVREGSTPLFKVFLVHVDETKSRLFTQSADTLVTRLYLNENFSRYIRNTCTPLLGKDRKFLGYVPSLDSEILFKKRALLMERLLGEYKMQYVSGSLEQVVGHIFSQCEDDS